MNKRSILLAAACLGGFAAPVSAEPAYLETFPEWRDASRHTRIAEAAHGWQVVTDTDGTRFFRVTVRPEKGKRRALVVWDLAPVQFQTLSLQVRADKPGIFFSCAAADLDKTSYAAKYFGETAGGTQRVAIATGDSWSIYTVRFPQDLDRINMRGKEVAPYQHARGDEVKAWESIDFTNRGFKTLYFHAECLPGSPLIGGEFTVDFKLLELSNP